jgi:hypothetical protein
MKESRTIKEVSMETLKDKVEKYVKTLDVMKAGLERKEKNMQAEAKRNADKLKEKKARVKVLIKEVEGYLNRAQKEITRREKQKGKKK